MKTETKDSLERAKQYIKYADIHERGSLLRANRKIAGPRATYLRMFLVTNNPRYFEQAVRF